MKKFIFAALLPTLLIFSSFVFAQQTDFAKQTEVKAVSTVDLKRYAGKWFEIARYPNKFQKKCVGNTTATYVLKENDNLQVINECVLKNGATDKAEGEAKVVDKTSNAKLDVRFAPKFLSFLSAVWGDYWIIDLDADYKYAAVADPKRENLWILSRESELNDAVYQNILRRVETMGFKPGKLSKTPQNVEVVKGAVIEKQ